MPQVKMKSSFMFQVYFFLKKGIHKRESVYFRVLILLLYVPTIPHWPQYIRITSVFEWCFAQFCWARSTYLGHYFVARLPFQPEWPSVTENDASCSSTQHCPVREWNPWISDFNCSSPATRSRFLTYSCTHTRTYTHAERENRLMYITILSFTAYFSNCWREL